MSKIVTLTGVTCSGKSTIEQELMRAGFGRIISHTTRNPRIGEVNGEHYHFASDFEFGQLQGQGEFVELITFGTRRYGVAKSSLRTAVENHDRIAVVVDPHGAEQIHNYCHQIGVSCMGVWIECDPVQQARRYVMRIAGDMLIGKEAVGAHAERLSMMLTEEVEWRRLARRNSIGGGWSYSLRLVNSDSDTPVAAAAKIMALLQ